MGRFYATTPIYYVNDVPHLGTAYTTIVTDALRRFHQVIGDETFMLTGTDEHGLKIEREANKQGVAPKAFCDDISKRFRDAWPKLDIAADRFIRTTDADHEAFVAELWKKIEAKGDLYEADYEGWYCVGCESLKTEKELEQPGNICPLHKTPVERVKEQSYFFKLEKWQQPLLDFYARHPDFIQPVTRKNEVLSFVQSGLKDLSVSRTTFKWGIPVPGNPKHVMYVWFDALTNYRSALGNGPLTRFWAPNAKVVHLVGKDILRFHAVFWPAFLLAAGYKEEELPDVVYAHGFLTVDGQKMSKTLRNAVDPLRLAETLGADTLRYHLLRAISFGQDGDFDHAALLERYNADLGKNVGNLLNRVLGLCVKNTDGKHPDDDVATDGPIEAELFEAFEQCVGAARTHWCELAPHLALEQTMRLSSAANTYVDRAAPWNELKNGNLPRVRKILSRLLRVLEALSVMLWPAMPVKADAMRAQLGLPPVRVALGLDVWPMKMPSVRAGLALAPAGPLFPTYDEKAQAELLAKLAPPKPEAPAKPAPPVVTAPATTEGTTTIAYDDFAKVDLRVGVVKTCEKVPKKDKLLRLTVDLGEPEPRTIVAGLALSFQPDALVGRKVIVVANLAPREFGSAEFVDPEGGANARPKKVKLVSHGMLLASGPSEDLRLATIDGDAAPGARLK